MAPYLRDPLEIERQSFRRIRELADLSCFDPMEAQVVLRLIHACGDISIVPDLRIAKVAVPAGMVALQRAAPILCDVEMVRHGLKRRYVAGKVLCFLHAEGVAERAMAQGKSRSEVALDYWPLYLEQAVVVIGTAPTALFRLLELLEDGAPHPALIIGMPAGFVSAAEAKQALVEQASHLNIPYITLLGPRGGSPLAVAVLNALAYLTQGVSF